jgi:hypothetical protein
VPALLLVVPSTAVLSASSGIVQAIEECRLEPGVAAPSGSKWLYRINRDHRRCWFLSSIGGHHTQSRRAASVRSRHLAGGTNVLRQDHRRDSDLQPASAPIGKTDIAVAAETPAVPQTTTPSIDQSSANLIAHSVPTIAYKVLPTTAQTVLGPRAGAAARIAEPAPAGTTNTNLVLFAGAAAAALLVAGGMFHITRQNQRRTRSYAGAARHAIRGSALIRSSVAAKRPPLPTDPADDLRRSLLELKRDLKNASEASNMRPLRGKGSSSGAVSLPHAEFG